MSYAIRAPDYQHPAALSPSTNDENESGGGGGKEEGGLKEVRGKTEAETDRLVCYWGSASKREKDEEEREK